MSTKRYFESIGAWPHGSVHMERTYVIGFLVSLLLTLGAFALAEYHILPPNLFVFAILVFASAQFIVQVLSFLHVSGEQSSFDKLLVLLTAAILILILVLGSMWIMADLDGRMMLEDEQVEQYMTRQQGF